MRCNGELDSVDMRILKLLQQDCRISNSDLAVIIGLTEAPVLRRVQKLYKSGVIKGFHARLDESHMGFDHKVLVMVKLKEQNKKSYAFFESEMKKWVELEKLMLVRGGFDYIVDFRLKSHLDEKNLLLRLSAIDGIQNIETMTVIETVVDRPLLNIG